MFTNTRWLVYICFVIGGVGAPGSPQIYHGAWIKALVIVSWFFTSAYLLEWMIVSYNLTGWLVFLPYMLLALAAMVSAWDGVRHFHKWGDSSKGAWLYLLCAFLMIYSIQGMIRHFVIKEHYMQYVQQSHAMEPFILKGETLLIHRWNETNSPFDETFSAEWLRGKVLAFKDPFNPQTVFIKRVIGTPLDVIEIRGDRLFLNGEFYVDLKQNLRESSQNTVLGMLPHRIGPYVIPPEHVFVLGDLPNESFDSRIFGAIAMDQIVGDAGRIIRSPKSWNLLNQRWSRLGLSVNTK
jgi:signal peptidase I